MATLRIPWATHNLVGANQNDPNTLWELEVRALRVQALAGLSPGAGPAADSDTHRHTQHVVTAARVFVKF